MNNSQYFITTSHTEKKEEEDGIFYFDVYDFIKNIKASNDQEAIGIFISFNYDIYKEILIANRKREIEGNPDYFKRYGCDNIEEYKENLIIQIKTEIIKKPIEHGFLIARALEFFPSDNENEKNKLVQYYLFKKAS